MTIYKKIISVIILCFIFNILFANKVQDAAIYRKQGFIKSSNHDYIGAIQDLNYAIKLTPKDSYLYYSRAGAKRNLQDYTGAIKDYTKAIKINPKDKDYYFARAYCYNSLGKKQKALEDLSMAGELGDAMAYEYIKKIQNEK